MRKRQYVGCRPAVCALILAGAYFLSGCSRTDAQKETYILRWYLRSGETLELESSSRKVRKLVNSCWDGEEFFCPEITYKNTGRVLINESILAHGMPDEASREQYRQLLD